MDGLFIADDDIIGTDSDGYKPFDLEDEWRVSPGTGDFLLRSPELNFTFHSYLEKENVSSDVKKGSEVKQEIKEEGSSPNYWFSVLESKHLWKENNEKTLEERYLTEQVVPDQVNVMELANQTSDPLRRCSEDVRQHKFSKELCPEKMSLENVMQSTNEVNNSTLKSATSINSKSPMFISEVDNYKEQVSSNRLEGFQPGPAGDTYTFNALCDRVNLEQMAKTKLPKETSESSKSAKVDEELSNNSPRSLEQTLEKVEDGSHFTLTHFSNKLSTSETIKYRIQDVKLEEKPCVDAGDILIQNFDVKDFAFKIHKKLIKVLTPERIPKCTMVEYCFDSSEKLPWFSDVFCLSSSKEGIVRGSELPDVLKCQQKDQQDEDLFIVLSDSDSECDSVDVEQKSSSQSELLVGNKVSSDDGSIDNVTLQEFKMEIQENRDPITSEFTAKTPFSELESIEESSNMLALDDELENFLVSNLVLTGNSSGENPQLPDLSDNLSNILRNDNPGVENPLKSVHRSMFPRPGVGLPNENTLWGRMPRTDQAINLHQGCDSYGNILNAALLGSGGRLWQINDIPKQQYVNTMYANYWAKNATNENYHNQTGRRRFTNDRIYNATGNEPFMHAVPSGAPNLPPNVIQTGIEDFEFSSSATRVEVVDSSLNYEF